MCQSAALVATDYADSSLYVGLDSLFSYSLSYSSSSTLHPFGFSNAVNRFLYSEGSSGSSGLYISLNLNRSLYVLS
jgi:hypothetical protein